jgi:hypothetical protein
VRERKKRWVQGVLIALVILVLTGAAGLRIAGRALEERWLSPWGREARWSASGSA